MMQESKAFSKGVDSKYERDWDNSDLNQTLDFYFQLFDRNEFYTSIHYSSNFS